MLTEQSLHQTAEHFVALFREYCRRVDDGLHDDKEYSTSLNLIASESEEALWALHALSVLLIKSSIFDFPLDDYNSQIYLLRSAAYERCKSHNRPRDSVLPSLGASGAYIVEHIEPDPDACPDCLGTRLDFTHHADHCLSCIVPSPAPHKIKPGDSARSPAGASGFAVGQGKHQ
jgi:hypothetical protein